MMCWMRLCDFWRNELSDTRARLGMKRDDPKNKSSQEAQEPEQHGEKGNVLSIVDRINVKRNDLDRVRICPSMIRKKECGDDEDGQH